MPSKDTQYLYISNWTIIRLFAIIFGIALIYFIRDVAAALLLAIIVASSMEPAVRWLKERKIPRILGVVTIYLVILGFLFLFIYLVFPLLLEDLRDISSVYPALKERAISGVEQSAVLPFTSIIAENIETFLKIPPQYFAEVSGNIVNFASAVFGGIFSLILIVVFSFYLAAQERGIENFLRILTPVAYEPYVVDLWERSQRQLGRWFRAQLLLAAIVGVLIFFGLTLMGIEHALVFAILAAVFEIIPVVGPILAAVPAVITAVFVSPLLALMVVALYIVVQQIESQVIVPVVMRRAIGLSPLLVLLALVIGIKVGGILGILLAVPITAVLAELASDWDKKKRALMPETE